MIRWEHQFRGGSNARPAWSRALAGLVLVAYGLVLGGSPLEQGWNLAIHLAKDHHGAAHHHTSEQDEHAGLRPAMFAGTDLDDIDLPVAPNMPHEHNGRLHTHDQRPTEHPFLLTITLAKYYLFSAPLLPVLPPARDKGLVSSMVAPHQITLSVETPPPRLPG